VTCAAPDNNDEEKELGFAAAVRRQELRVGIWSVPGHSNVHLKPSTLSLSLFPEIFKVDLQYYQERR
jgi:hypothetical protein